MYSQPPTEKPSDISTIGALLLAGGIISVLWSLGVFVITIGICFPFYGYGLGAGINSIIQGSKMLGDDCYGMGVPKTAAILQICQIINFGDFFGMGFGIAALVMTNNPQVQAYLEGSLALNHQQGHSTGALQGEQHMHQAGSAQAPAAESHSASLAGRNTMVESDMWNLPASAPGRQEAAPPLKSGYTPGLGAPAPPPSDASWQTQLETPAPGTPTFHEETPPKSVSWEEPTPPKEAASWEEPASSKWEPLTNNAPKETSAPEASPWGSDVAADALKEMGTKALEDDNVNWARGSTWKATQSLEEENNAAPKYEVASWTDWNKAPLRVEDDQATETKPAEVGVPHYDDDKS